jgi:protein phosphatase
MGTTLVCLLIDGDSACVGNVGDSRAYLIDESGIRQITADHSLVSEMVARGELSAVEAQRHPSRNVITRALGVDSSVVCDIFPLSPQPGQFVLLCSDGLTGEVSEPEIYYEVFGTQRPEFACQSLVDIANARGGRDNITVVLVQFE